MVAPDQNPGYDNWKDFQAVNGSFSHIGADILLDDMDIFSNYCALYQRENLQPQITIVNLHIPNQQQTLKLPIGTIASASNFTFTSNTLRFSFSSPLIADTFYELNMGDMTLTNLTPGNIRLDDNQYVYSVSYAISEVS